MRDPIRNYRKILAGGNIDSDTDESQPLLSTSYASTSSASSFGSVFNGSSDLESEHNKPSSVRFEKKNKNSVSSLSIKGKFESLFVFDKGVEPPIFDVYSATTDLVFGKNNCYSEVDVPMNINIRSPLKLNPSSSGASSYDHLMDYKRAEKHTHNSLVTIFAIWNTTMGSSLLAMSWGINMAGLFPGIAINILMAALCLYTCHLLLIVNGKHGILGKDIEVSHLCKDLLGKWAEISAKILSVVVLLGADIVYMILMSNFLYNSVYFIYELIVLPFDPIQTNLTILCPKEVLGNVTDSSTISMHQSQFDSVWNLHSTVPVFLAVILFCVLNFKSQAFFAKFNSLGTISVVYLLIFVAVKAYGWGINISDWSAELLIKPSFSALSGMLSMSYFIHNIIISIMRNNKLQEHNGRDLSIAFGLVTFTYLFIGVIFYICFPLAKSCIEDNIFNNFSKSDTLTIIARILLMFQLFTVFPLISFMLRKDILSNINHIFQNHTFGDFTYGRVMFLNGGLLVICVLFACFLPKIGTLIRYTGAISGLVYIFMLPNLLKMASLKKERNLTTIKAAWHIFIIIAGAVNLFSQFFVVE